MPIVSQFYGIIIRMFFNDNEKIIHHIFMPFTKNMKHHLILMQIYYKEDFIKNKEKLFKNRYELKLLWKTIHEDNEFFTIEALK